MERGLKINYRMWKFVRGEGLSFKFEQQKQTAASCGAVPDFALNRKKKALALARRKLPGHDLVSVVDKILGCRKYANDRSGLITRDDGDPGSV